MNHYHPGSGLLILAIALVAFLWGLYSPKSGVSPDGTDTPSRDREESDE